MTIHPDKSSQKGNKQGVKTENQEEGSNHRGWFSVFDLVDIWTDDYTTQLLIDSKHDSSSEYCQLLGPAGAKNKMTEHWPAASCPWAKSKWVAPWTLLAWLVTTTPPIPSTPFHAFRREAFLLLHGMDPEPFLALLAIKKKIFIYVFGCAGSSLWHMGSSSLSRDGIQAPSVESAVFTTGSPGEFPIFFLGMIPTGVCFLHQGPFPSVLALGNTIWNHKKKYWHVFLSRVPWGGESGPEDNNNFIEKQTGLERKLSGPMEADQPQYTVPSSCSASLEGTAPGQKGQRCPTLEVYTAKLNPCKCLWVWYRQEYRSKDRCTGTFSRLQDLIRSFHREHLWHWHLCCKHFCSIFIT